MLQYVLMYVIFNLSEMLFPKLQTKRNELQMNMNYLSENENKLTLHTNDFTENLQKMTNEQLSELMKKLCDLYVEYDEKTSEYFGMNEYFRLQIDFIANYAKRERNLIV